MPVTRSMKWLCLLPALLLLQGVGCDSTGPSTSDKDLEHLEYRQLEETLKEASEKKPVVLVDVRTPDRFAKAHLPNAINIPLAELNPRDPRLAKADKIVVYHEDFKGSYADIAAKKLLAAGLDSVYSYAGGYQDWASRQADPSLKAEPKKGEPTK